MKTFLEELSELMEKHNALIQVRRFAFDNCSITLSVGTKDTYETAEFDSDTICSDDIINILE